MDVLIGIIWPPEQQQCCFVSFSSLIWLQMEKRCEKKKQIFILKPQNSEKFRIGNDNNQFLLLELYQIIVCLAKEYFDSS